MKLLLALQVTIKKEGIRHEPKFTHDHRVSNRSRMTILLFQYRGKTAYIFIDIFVIIILFYQLLLDLTLIFINDWDRRWNLGVSVTSVRQG